MELILPHQIALDHTSEMLLEDARETATRVSEYRPLAPAVVRRIEEELLGERVYSSNAIEGNTLDLRETEVILRTGTIDAQRPRESLEARNLGEAVQKVGELARDADLVLSTDILRDIHRIILREINDDWAGKYREHQVTIRGAKYQPPDHSLVPTLVDRVFEQLNSRDVIDPLVRSAWAHWAIARIHPFHDGNGRLARLWQDLLLFRGGLTCAIIRPADRRDYLSALSAADEGNFNALVQLIAQRVSSTFDHYLTHIQSDKEDKEWAAKIAGEVDRRVEDRSELAFMRWRRRMMQLRFEFVNCAARISEVSNNLRVQVDDRYDCIDRNAWQILRSGLSTQRTWFFRVDFSAMQKRSQFIFFFGKHYWSDFDTVDERNEHPVCLLISLRVGSEEPRRLDQIDDCKFSVRELWVVKDFFIRKRKDFATGNFVYDREITPSQIAKDFFEEIVRNSLT